VWQRTFKKAFGARPELSIEEEVDSDELDEDGDEEGYSEPGDENSPGQFEAGMPI
jgi:hypothetical protein